VVTTRASSNTVAIVTGHLSEGSFVRKVVVQIPKFDAKPNPDLALTLTNPNPSPNPNSNPNPSPNPNRMLICLGQMTLRTSELLPLQHQSSMQTRSSLAQSVIGTRCCQTIASSDY